MSSNPDAGTTAGGVGATENSEGGSTMAVQKKRLRRVSFAEMTSIHFFDRDEEYNESTPAEESGDKASNVDDDKNEKESKENNDLLGFRELEDEFEVRDAESDDEELANMQRSFLRPMESPSTGSTFGSATSNDEDNFFGPVSTSFIRHGRLSDSAASDDNHDVTMDSTAFSMHFRSLARSDTGADLKTPTGVHLSLEEKTPTNTNIGSSMELTALRKPISQSSSPAWNMSSSSGSSDMSLVGDNPSKYDYGRISPGLDALLAEGSKNLNNVSVSDNTVASISPRNMGSKFFESKENGSGFMDLIDNGKGVTSLHSKSVNGNVSSPTSPASRPAHDFSSNALPSETLVDKSNSSPHILSNARTSLSHLHEFGSADRYIHHKSPLVEFIPSSPAKGRHRLTGSASSTKYMSVLTPEEKRGSFLLNENVKHDESAASIQKSISKLKLLEASPFSSSLTAKLENSTVGVFNSLIKQLDAPETGTEGQMSGVYYKKGKSVHASSRDGNQIDGQVTEGYIVHAEECTATWSGKNMKHDLFRSKILTEKELVTCGTVFSPYKHGLECVDEEKPVSTPNYVVPSQDKGLEKKIVSPEPQGRLSSDLKLRNQLMTLKRNFFSDHGSASKADIIDANLSTAPPDKSNSFSVGTTVRPGSPLVGVKSFNLIEISAMDDANHHDQQGNNEIIGNILTPMEEKGSPSFHWKKLDGSLQTGMKLSRLQSEHPGEESEATPSGSAAASINKNLKELMPRKNLLDCFTQTPLKKVVQINSNDNIGLHDVEDALSPITNKFDFPARKRKNEVVALEEREDRNNIAAFQRSPKLQKLRNDDLGILGIPTEDGEETSVNAHESQNWTDIYLKFSTDAEELFSASVHEPTLSVIELLEDVLIHLQRSKAFGTLHKEISAQKKSFVDGLHHERVGEARSLLHQIMHEKAKSLLMRVKQQKLKEKLGLLSSGIQESKTLKMNSLPKCMENAQAETLSLQMLANLKHTDEVYCDKVTVMKQALEALDRKTANLVTSLNTACKIKGETSCAESIVLANGHLLRKSCCRLIRFDMQMWTVDDLKSCNGHHNIVLNYHGFVIQSLKVTVPSASSIVISNKLDNTKIVKSFPNMDAFTAFSFVFNAETTQKYSGSRSLAQQTQVTRSLLGNLVDVIQELQLAQIELPNLTQTTFCCTSVGQLNLHLCFFNFKSGKKVTLTLDISCLNRGIYPSEILPSQLSAAEPILGKIRDGTKSLRPGYMRILRLCRHVSQVVQDSRE